MLSTVSREPKGSSAKGSWSKTSLALGAAETSSLISFRLFLGGWVSSLNISLGDFMADSAPPDFFMSNRSSKSAARPGGGGGACSS